MLQTEKGIKYEAESPDEAALVVAAKVMGFFFFKRTATSVTVRECTPRGTHDVQYEVGVGRMGGTGGGGGTQDVHTHARMHAHTCTCTCPHAGPEHAGVHPHAVS